VGILKGVLAVFDIIKQARQLLLDAVKRIGGPIGGVEVCPVFFNVGQERLDAGPDVRTMRFWHFRSLPPGQRSWP